MARQRPTKSHMASKTSAVRNGSYHEIPDTDSSSSATPSNDGSVSTADSSCQATLRAPQRQEEGRSMRKVSSGPSNWPSNVNDTSQWSKSCHAVIEARSISEEISSHSWSILMAWLRPGDAKGHLQSGSNNNAHSKDGVWTCETRAALARGKMLPGKARWLAESTCPATLKGHADGTVFTGYYETKLRASTQQ